jgi:hypothetical protein
MPQVTRILVLALLLAACGSESGGGSAAVPSGFERLDGPGYTLAHPAGWQPLNAANSRGAQGPKGTGGLAPQAVVGRGRITAPLDLSVQGLEADNRVRRAGYKIVREGAYHVAGATGARLLEAVYRVGATPVRTIDLLVQTKQGVAYDLFLRAPEADFDRVGMRKVLSSFRLTP